MNTLLKDLDHYIDCTIKESKENTSTLDNLIHFYRAMDNVRRKLLSDDMSMTEKVAVTARYKILFKYYLDAGADVHPRFLERIISIHTLH